MVSRTDQPDPKPVFNVQVQGTHVYLVGADGVLVHNGVVCTKVNISRSLYPEAAQHIEDAQAAGQPLELTIERAGAAARRAEALAGQQRVPGAQLDEYPPAMFAEGGTGASVRPISPADNMGAGAAMGNFLRPIPDGSKVIINVVQ